MRAVEYPSPSGSVSLGNSRWFPADFLDVFNKMREEVLEAVDAIGMMLVRGASADGGEITVDPGAGKMFGHSRRLVIRA